MIRSSGWEEMSYETAANIQRPVGTVCSRLSRGRDALRLLMGLQEKAGRTVEALGRSPDRLRLA